GHTFAGWYTDADLTVPFDFDTPVTGDMPLYAGRLVNQYTVTYAGNGSDGGRVPAPVTADYESDITVADNTGGLTKTGHTFAGWNTAANGSGTSYQAGDTFQLGTSDVTLYAQWEKNRYTVTFDSNGGTSVASQDVLYGEKAAEPPAPKKKDHTFVGWFTDIDLTVPFDFDTAITGDLTLHAKWDYTVIVNLTATARDRAVRLNWHASVDDSLFTYTVYISVDAAPADLAGWQLVQDYVTGNTFTVTGLTNGRTYAFGVKAVYAEGQSDLSNVAIA